MLGELITSKTRLRLLIKFFVSQANSGYLNGLANEMGESTNGIRKELNHLHGAGYIKKIKYNNKIEYKANTKHPLFEVLRKVVFKHLGLEDLVETVLERMGDVDQIILIGDYARGNDSGLIEVFLTPLKKRNHSGNRFLGSASMRILRQYKFTPGSIRPKPKPSMFSLGV